VIRQNQVQDHVRHIQVELRIALIFLQILQVRGQHSPGFNHNWHHPLMQLLKVLCGAVEAAAATASDGSSQDQNCDEATQDYEFDIVQCLQQVLTFVP
jgi:hypothetical protein